jgi:hypothetical protein
MPLMPWNKISWKTMNVLFVTFIIILLLIIIFYR